MYAVEFPSRVIFSVVPVPLKLRDEIRDEMGGKIRVGVTLDVPEDYAEWPPGSPSPDQVLCVSKGDPDHFVVVKYRRDVDRATLNEDGRNWSAIGSMSGWVTFMDTLRNLNRIARDAQGAEASDIEEEELARSGGAV